MLLDSLKYFLLKQLCEDLRRNWQIEEGDGVPHRARRVGDLQGHAGRRAGAAQRPPACTCTHDYIEN